MRIQWYVIYNACHCVMMRSHTMMLYTLWCLYYAYYDNEVMIHATLNVLWWDKIHSMMIMHVMMMYNLLCCYTHVFDVHTMLMMHAMMWWCIPMHYDVHLVTTMMMMHTLWWRSFLMIYYEDACLMFCEKKAELLVRWLCMTRCTRMNTCSIWQWNDLFIYSDDLAVIREQRLSTKSLVIGFDRSTGSVLFFFRVVGWC